MVRELFCGETQRASNQFTGFSVNQSGAVFFQSAGMRQRQRHQVLGFELSEPTAQALRLAKGVAGIETAILRDEQRGHRMPTV